MKFKAIVFDFGGTLDTDGIHWGEKFWEAYLAFNMKIPKNDFREAFVWASRNIAGLIKPDFLLLENLAMQLTLQKQFLNNKYPAAFGKSDIVDELSSYCYKEVVKNIKISEPILKELKQDFQLGLVSNYFGNMTGVLEELSLLKYFDSVIDSTIVEIRKPDPRIFEFALTELNVEPAASIVVGDSYKNDIAPAKMLGCSTIWINVKGWETTVDISCADGIIKSIKYLPKKLKEFELT
jgi:HAD superfamily hydrolase (TIGR01509 family)